MFCEPELRVTGEYFGVIEIAGSKFDISPLGDCLPEYEQSLDLALDEKVVVGQLQSGNGAIASCCSVAQTERSPDERRQERQTRSQPLLTSLRDWFKESLTKTSRKSETAKQP